MPGHRPLLETSIVVLQIFSLDVYGSKGKPLSTEQLYNQLKVIVEQSQYPGTPVGLLTTLDRDSWGALYTEMVKGTRRKLFTFIVRTH